MKTLLCVLCWVIVMAMPVPDDRMVIVGIVWLVALVYAVPSDVEEAQERRKK